MRNLPAFFRSRLIVAAVAALPAAAGAVELEIVNRTTLVAAIDSNGHSSAPCGASADGRYTLFGSQANNLVPGDTNLNADLFLHDAQTQSLERVSVGSGGVQADAGAGRIGGVSDDGRYVVFDSTAINLVPGAGNGVRQIYLRDRSDGTTTLLSGVGGAPAPFDSANPRLSGDGRYVVFDSRAALIAEDDNGQRDIYRLDRNNGSLELISVSADGRLGNGDSYEPQISADGSAVLFYTWSSNLVAGDTNNVWDLLLRKSAAGTTQRVSVDSTGAGFEGFPRAAAQALSGDGRYALFNIYLPGVPDDSNGTNDGFRYDSQDGSIRRVTLGPNGAELATYSTALALSRDGQQLLMQSGDTSLPGASIHGMSRHYLRDLSSGAISLVPFRAGGLLPAEGTEDGVLSGDGDVVFATTIDDALVDDDHNGMRDVLRQRIGAPSGQRLSRSHAGSAGAFANGDSGDWLGGFDVGSDGRYVVFGSDADNLVVGDFNGVGDVFLRDRLLGQTERISRRAGGQETSCPSFGPRVSRDGRYVVFISCDALAPTAAGGSYEIYRYDRQTSQMALVSQTPQGFGGGGEGSQPSISDDGRYVAFTSSSASLVAGDDNGYADAFLRDMDSGVTVLASRTPNGSGGDWDSAARRLSGDGRYLLFASRAGNFVAGDGNDAGDGFVFDRVLQTVERVTLGGGGLEPDGNSTPEDISRDGRYVAFTSWAANLTGLPPPHYERAFLRDRLNGTTEPIGRRNDGELLNAGISTARLSDDASRIVFLSSATNSGAPDTATRPYHYFLYERERHRLSTLVAFGEYEAPDRGCALSGDGEHLVFGSSKIDLVPDDGNNQFNDVFLVRRLSDFLFADGYETAE